MELIGGAVVVVLVVGLIYGLYKVFTEGPFDPDQER